MTEIKELAYPENVTLLPGAAQHWSDLERNPAAAAGAARRLLGHLDAAGKRVVVVGPHSPETIAALAEEAAELVVVVRSIPDAAQLGEAAPSAKVFCGDVARLDAGTFDLVVALDDLARVLSLESDIRPWAEVFEAVAALRSPGGVLALGIENDLGVHRLTGTHSPYTVSSNADWAVNATWDASRPRTSAAVARLAEGDHQEWSVFPSWARQDVLATVGLSGGLAAIRDCLAYGSALEPFVGSDPTFVLRGAEYAGRMDDLAAGWFVVLGTPVAPTVLTADAEIVDAGSVPDAARSLVAALIEDCAAHDLPALRTKLTGWARAGVGPLTDVLIDADSYHRLPVSSPTPQTSTPELVERPEPAATDAPEPAERSDPKPWTCLADFVNTLRGRGLRHPWPSALDDLALLRAVGAMAELDDPGDDELNTLLGLRPKPSGAYANLDRQGLIALLDRQGDELRALRSREHWTELQFVSHKLRAKAVAETKKAAKVPMRAARKLLRKLGR